MQSSLKFTPEGGTIRVSLERESDAATLTVRDSGVGIAPELLPHIFERFRQADGSAKRKYGSLGLGLIIVKHLVEMHGGEVAAYSEGKNRGSTFTVRLPLVPQTAAQGGWQTAMGANGDSQQRGKPLDGIRILLVDDDADALEMMRFVLSAKGAALTCVRSAPEAVQILSGQEFDLLISDLGMPEVSGYDFIREVREILPADKLPAIALTGYVSADDRERVLQAGFQTHLPKPVEIEQLPLVILSVTRNRQQTSARG